MRSTVWIVATIVTAAACSPAPKKQPAPPPKHVEGGPAGADTGMPRGTYWLESIDLAGTVAGTRFDVRLFVKVSRHGPGKP